MLSTSWLTKCAVMPTMAIMATRLRPRAIRKVLARGAEPVLERDMMAEEVVDPLVGVFLRVTLEVRLFSFVVVC